VSTLALDMGRQSLGTRNDKPTNSVGEFVATNSVGEFVGLSFRVPRLLTLVLDMGRMIRNFFFLFYTTLVQFPALNDNFLPNVT